MSQIDREGRYSAATAEGFSLPVLDIGNPAFALAHPEAEIERLTAAFIAAEEQRGPLARFGRKLMLKLLGNRSLLVRAIGGSGRDYLGSLPTYVLKLGPTNLSPPFDTPIDRIIVATIPSLSLRIRLEQCARLLAGELEPALLAAPGAPLVLFEIAGGPSMDGINALLLLHRKGVLGEREVTIEVLDIDPSGPAFGGNALAALQAPGGPLAGVRVKLTAHQSAWQDIAGLEAVLSRAPATAICAATSEGGLFEYGSDGDIAAVLGALAARVDIVVGSSTRADHAAEVMRRINRTQVVMRGAEAVGRLAAPAGYRLTRTLRAPFSDQVLLRRG